MRRDRWRFVLMLGLPCRYLMTPSLCYKLTTLVLRCATVPGNRRRPQSPDTVWMQATFYKEMVQFVHKCDTSHMLPALKQAQEHGVAATSATEQADGAVAEIDWDIGTDADTGADIDWGVGGGEPAAAEIDWGISGGDDTGQEDEAGEIDWGGGTRVIVPTANHSAFLIHRGGRG
jgi:hypothetical protein